MGCMMNRPLLHRPALASCCGMAIALSLAVASAACGRSEAAAADQAPPPPEVVVHTVAPKAVTLTTELPGRTAPYGIAEVRPQVSGIIQRRLFVEGTTVSCRRSAVPDRSGALRSRARPSASCARAVPSQPHGGPFTGRALPRSGRDQRRQQTGIRRCRSRPATSGGEHRRERGGCPHRTDRSRLHARDLAHCWPRRAFVGDRGSARHRQPATGTRHDATAASDLCRRGTVERRSAAPSTAAGRWRADERSPGRSARHIAARGRHALRAHWAGCNSRRYPSMRAPAP